MTNIVGQVGTKKLFENDRVIVWETRLRPGEKGDLHEHKHDYVIVVIEGDRAGADIAPEAQGPKNAFVGQRMEGDIHQGFVLFVEKGSVETAVNVGEQPFYEITVELKE